MMTIGQETVLFIFIQRRIAHTHTRASIAKRLRTKSEYIWMKLKTNPNRIVDRMTGKLGEMTTTFCRRRNKKKRAQNTDVNWIASNGINRSDFQRDESSIRRWLKWNFLTRIRHSIWCNWTGKMFTTSRMRVIKCTRSHRVRVNISASPTGWVTICCEQFVHDSQFRHEMSRFRSQRLSVWRRWLAHSPSTVRERERFSLFFHYFILLLFQRRHMRRCVIAAFDKNHKWIM